MASGAILYDMDELIPLIYQELMTKPNHRKQKLEQLERLRSEDTPRRPMITPYYWPVYFESQVHINDQFISDPKSKQGESRKIRKFATNRNFRILL